MWNILILNFNFILTIKKESNKSKLKPIKIDKYCKDNKWIDLLVCQSIIFVKIYHKIVEIEHKNH